MAHVTAAYTSNFDESKELATLTQQGKPVHWPPLVHSTGERGGEAPPEVHDVPHSEGPVEEWGEGASVGTSSSTSESKPEKSGSSVQETESPLQSPAQTAGNPSALGQASRQVQSSTAPSTSGSTQETGLSQADQSVSSAVQPTQGPSGTVVTPPPSGRELIHQAREAYNGQQWSLARELLEAAKEADPSLEGEVTVALQAVQTASEATPSAGGFLVQ